MRVHCTTIVLLYTTIFQVAMLLFYILVLIIYAIVYGEFETEGRIRGARREIQTICSPQHPFGSRFFKMFSVATERQTYVQ